MASLPVFVGLDYHDVEVQVCVMDAAGKVTLNRSVANRASQIDAVVRGRGQLVSAAIESCCGAADLAEELATHQGWSIQLAHPGYVGRMKQSPDKTDYGDARLLADLARVDYVPKVWLAPQATRQLRRLVRHRQQLVQRRTNVKLRIRALLRENRVRPPESCNAWTKRWLAWLKSTAPLAADDRWLLDQHLADLEHLGQRIQQVEGRLAERAENDPLAARLLEQAGVGLVTAMTLRAEIGRFDRFANGKQLARFCGVTPRNASSGQRQADAGLIKAGNPGLRQVLIELAHRLIHRLQGPWAELAAKLLKRGKAKNVVVAAVANRWIRWLYHQMQPLPDAA
jgi:transposase